MNSSGKSRTPISSLGKYGLLGHILKDNKTRSKATVISAGDDAAALQSKGLLTLVSTDLLLEGIHFNLVYTPLKHLGYKAVIRGISDIYAMNGMPEQILISLGISSRFSVEETEELYLGINSACENYNIDLAGGDITSSLTGLTICVTAAGTVAPEKLVKRSGARPNDLICITGDIGSAYMGLQLLERERKLFEEDSSIRPELAGHEYIIGKQLKPEFPAKTLSRLAETGILPTSMIDVSEGLASDLLQLCSSSGTGCRIYIDKVPVDAETAKMAEEFRIDPLTAALNGGEDYELLFTVSLEMFEKVREVEKVRVIGHMTQDDYGMFAVTGDGEEAELKAQGWK
jgi:thiamine-monophosphate kinase